MKVLMHALAASCEELRARTGNPPLLHGPILLYYTKEEETTRVPTDYLLLVTVILSPITSLSLTLLCTKHEEICTWKQGHWVKNAFHFITVNIFIFMLCMLTDLSRRTFYSISLQASFYLGHRETYLRTKHGDITFMCIRQLY